MGQSTQFTKDRTGPGLVAAFVTFISIPDSKPCGTDVFLSTWESPKDWDLQGILVFLSCPLPPPPSSQAASAGRTGRALGAALDSDSSSQHTGPFHTDSPSENPSGVTVSALASGTFFGNGDVAYRCCPGVFQPRMAIERLKCGECDFKF